MGEFTPFSVIINSNLSLIERKHSNAKYREHVTSPWRWWRHMLATSLWKRKKIDVGGVLLSGYKCYSSSAITVKFSDNICYEID